MRVVYCHWNNLQRFVVNSSSVTIFQSRLDLFFKQDLLWELYRWSEKMNTVLSSGLGISDSINLSTIQPKFDH